jgi:hypothetical protein
MKYYVVENTGKGFITHLENKESHIVGYPANVWLTENTSWASRVNAVEITKVQAQELIDSSLDGIVYPEGHENEGQQVVNILP